MAFSYDPAQLEIALNRVRFLVSDTDAGEVLVQDEEINFLLQNQPNYYTVAAALCRKIAAALLREPNVDLGEIKLDAQSARAREMRLLADNYDVEAGKLALILATPPSEEVIDDFSLFGNCSRLGECETPSAFTRGLHFSN